MIKRLLAVLLVMVTMLTCVTGAEATTSKAQAFVKAVEAEKIGKTGADYGFTDQWCGRFVKYCADKAGIKIETKEYALVPLMAKWFSENGRFALTRRNASGEIKCWESKSCMWSDNKPAANYRFAPAPGDIAFFETGNPYDGIDHVGIVVGVNGNMVTIVDGNWGSKVSRRDVNWKMNESSIWGFARPVECGSMTSPATTPKPATSTGFSAGPKATVTVNSNGSVVVKWNKISGAHHYDVELYEAAGWKSMQNGATRATYLQKSYGITGTSKTFTGLAKGKTYYVWVAACNKTGSVWKFGSAASFTLAAASAKITIASLIASKTCRGYLTVTGNQRAYTNTALTNCDNSYIYPTDYCRIVKTSGNSLLVEYPTSGGKTKQRWIAASKFFCQYNYAVWSRTAAQSIAVKSRPGAGVNVGTIYKGDQVYVLGVSGAYYQVLYPAGSVWKFGYIAKGKL